jgi:prepilin peptidase CpaA
MAAASGVVLCALLAAACVSDLRTRRIPNALVVVTAIAGVIFSAVTKSFAIGLTQAGAGLLTGLAIWIPFYALRMLGAGDVKLFAAAATFLGARSAVDAAVYTALYGGALALLYMILNSGLRSTAIRLGSAMHQPSLLQNPTTSNRRRMPYAFAIAAGVITVLLLPGYTIL